MSGFGGKANEKPVIPCAWKLFKQMRRRATDEDSE